VVGRDGLVKFILVIEAEVLGSQLVHGGQHYQLNVKRNAYIVNQLSSWYYT